MVDADNILEISEVEIIVMDRIVLYVEIQDLDLVVITELVVNYNDPEDCNEMQLVV